MAKKKTQTEKKPKYRIIKQEIIEFTKKQNAGRVILFIIGLAFVGISIEPMVSSIVSIVQLGFKGDIESYYYLFKIVGGLLAIVLFAFECFKASIKGSVSVKSIFYFIMMIVLVVAQTILFFMSGKEITIYRIILFILEYLLPVGYIVGFGLLISGKHY